MVRSRRLVTAVVAVAVPLAGLVALAGPAGAKKVVATGSVTCHVSQTLSFNPPLTGLPAGNPGVAMDVITMSPPVFSQCNGTGVLPANVVPTSGGGTRSVVVKWKGIKIGTTKSAGSCNMLQSVSWLKVKPHLNWSAFPVKVKATKISNIMETSAASNGEQGFVFTGSTGGSFPGSVTLSDFFEQGSVASSTGSAALVACKEDAGTVSSLTTDPTYSTIRVGTGG